MKLSIDRESLQVLENLAKRLPGALEEIERQTERLLALYHSLAGSFGPHEGEIEQMLNIIRQAQLHCGDALHETACMIGAVAEKMASFLKTDPAAPLSSPNREDIRPRFWAAVKARLEDPGANPLVRQFYQQSEDHIRVADYDYRSTPRYNSLSRSIRLDGRADLHNPTGAMSAYFHEAGHRLDHLFAQGRGWLSSAPGYIASLREDFEWNVKNVMEEKGCGLEEAYDALSKEVSGVWESGVSDIFGSLSGCRCQGDWGHSPSYWSDSSRIAQEAFANMAEASIGDAHKLQSMKRRFPRAYGCFESIIGGVLHD